MAAFGKFERMMALRYIQSRKKEGFVSIIAGFSLLGICLGVATLIIVMSVMNGFRQELLSRILGLNGHLEVVSAYTPYLKGDYETLISKTNETGGVLYIMPSVEGQVMVSSDYTSQGAMVKGLDMEALPDESVIKKSLQSGTLERLKEKNNAVVVGSKLARKMNVRTGDEITLVSPEGKVTAFGTVPKMKSFVVAGTFDVGMFEYDANFIFMPIAESQKFFGTRDGISGIQVFLREADLTAAAAAELKESLKNYPVRIATWQQINRTFFNAIEVERNVMFMILTLIILVASFNMISGLVMLVNDKGKNIAVLRTMGATKGAVMRIFFISGSLIGVTGTLFGLIVGVLFCQNIEAIRQFLGRLTGTDLFSAEIYFLSTIPAQMDITEVISVVLMALGLTFLATLYPSWKAARLAPAEALRYE